MSIDLEAVLQRAEARFPGINQNGLSLPNGYYHPGRSPNTPFQLPENAEEILTAIDFLKLLTPTKTATLSQSTGSYGLKHMAENWGHDHGRSPYISNGELIVAAIWLDFPVRPYGWRNPNVAIGVSIRSIKQIFTKWPNIGEGIR